MVLFSKDLCGTFAERRNRFIALVDTSEGRLRVHCPNPGRLQEILLPGCPVILEKGTAPNRKTVYSLAAAIHHGKVIPLHASRANAAAQELILPWLYPQAIEVRREYRFGASRVDFAVESPGKRVLVEVKASSLCEHQVAMFPDAPTARGFRHIEELARFVREEKGAGQIIFVVSHADARVFAPDFHTDPAFAMRLQELSSILSVQAVVLTCDSDGRARVVRRRLPLRLDWANLARENAGVYMLLIDLSREVSIDVGALGSRRLQRGTYVYVGKAARNLRQRIERHRKRRKTLHWHVDYLTTKADSVRSFPIYTGLDLECTLAGEVALLSDCQVEGFGSSDCGCNSHLSRFDGDPMKSTDFVEMLFRYRHVECFSEHQRTVMPAETSLP